MIRVFVDTNVFVYAYGAQDARKQMAATSILETHINERSIFVSDQVLREFALASIVKLKHAPPVILDDIAALSELDRVSETPAMVVRAVLIQDRYEIQFYDALILAAAESAGCDLLLTEDLNHGQRYGAVLVQNPFLESPA